MKSIRCQGFEKLYTMLSGTKKRFADKQAHEKEVQDLLDKGELPYELTYKKFTVDIEKKAIDHMDYYILNQKGSNTSHKKILYLHGGAYVHQPTPSHWKFLNKIAKDTQTEIWVPIYPKVPFHDADYSYTYLMKLYDLFSASNYEEEFILMGDSAGGGLVLSMAQQIRDSHKKPPLELIMLSPWLDMTVSAPEIPFIELHDIMLGSYGLRDFGKHWAGNRSLEDSLVSPLYGQLTGLGKMTIFTGTYDILTIDSRHLLKKAKEQDVFIDFNEKEGMGHVYPLWPIPESKEVIEKIESIVVGNQ